METDKVAILTMTTHEDSKEQSNSRSKWKDQKGQKGVTTSSNHFKPSSSFPQKKSWFKSHVLDL
jgi:hypothetical protein